MLRAKEPAGWATGKRAQDVRLELLAYAREDCIP
jgi:hypothetical protein